MAVIANEGVEGLLRPLLGGPGSGRLAKWVAACPLTAPCDWGYGGLFPTFVSSRIVVSGAVPATGRVRFSMLCTVCRKRPWSSSRPMSSKCVVSDRIASAPDIEEERYEEDLEDLDPVKPGGEPGASFISS